MPWCSRDCQAALVSELHWPHRGQQRDGPFAAHPPGFIYLTAPFFQWHDYVLWQLQFRAENSSVVTSNPVSVQQSICFCPVFLFFLVGSECWCSATAADSTCPRFSTPTLLSSCSVRQAWSMLLQMPYATAAGSICVALTRERVNRITGGLQHHRSPLHSFFFSGYKCFPHLPSSSSNR